jgi:hypothetical protein
VKQTTATGSDVIPLKKHVIPVGSTELRVRGMRRKQEGKKNNNQ